MNVARILLLSLLGLCLAAVLVVAGIFHHYQRLVDERISRPLINNAAQIYGLPGADGKPRLITGLFDAKQRAKRRMLTYDQIPHLVVNALVSIEDRRFFEHNGINYRRLVGGLAAPLLGHRRMQGGSTLTMQMARGFFLNNQRTASRKFAELMIATELERRFSKQEILALYVNQVDMGQHGSFDIRGFGEAARVFFGKDINRLTLPEAATLAGLVNGPSYYSPYRHPDRAKARRNLVLQAMYENHVLDRESMERAKDAPLRLAPADTDAGEAPFYVDEVRDALLGEYDEDELNSGGLRVYTSLDTDLQRAADQAITVGMARLNKPQAQVALVCMDPHTGAVLAVSGGRSYADSQLNHATAKRPTGSIFKPFVYATALNSAVSDKSEQAYTEASTIDTSEGDFDSGGGKAYHPHNFDKNETGGDVTLRFALAHSINTATVRLAEEVGYEKVADLANAVGLTDVKPTPSMAIGTYAATPMQMAAAYTIFANGGVLMKPRLVLSVAGPDGEVQQQYQPEATKILDPRVAFVMTDMMEAVISEGTAAGIVRKRLTAPAAGKTGTSNDAWFAGYTSNLLCVVWVGNDDYSDIKMEGAKAAAPIWAEFMARARQVSRYRNMQPFAAPSGVVAVQVDKLTNLPATDKCPDDYQAYFVDGTVPRATCDHPDGDTRNAFQKMFGLGDKGGTLPEGSEPGKKRGFWRRLFGGRGNRKGQTAPPSTDSEPDAKQNP